MAEWQTRRIQNPRDGARKPQVSENTGRRSTSRKRSRTVPGAIAGNGGGIYVAAPPSQSGRAAEVAAQLDAAVLPGQNGFYTARCIVALLDRGNPATVLIDVGIALALGIPVVCVGGCGLGGYHPLLIQLDRSSPAEVLASAVKATLAGTQPTGPASPLAN